MHMRLMATYRQFDSLWLTVMCCMQAQREDMQEVLAWRVVNWEWGKIAGFREVRKPSVPPVSVRSEFALVSDDAQREVDTRPAAHAGVPQP